MNSVSSDAEQCQQSTTLWISVLQATVSHTVYINRKVIVLTFLQVTIIKTVRVSIEGNATSWCFGTCLCGRRHLVQPQYWNTWNVYRFPRNNFLPLVLELCPQYESICRKLGNTCSRCVIHWKQNNTQIALNWDSSNCGSCDTKPVASVSSVRHMT
jgi:hypothetical protein